MKQTSQQQTKRLKSEPFMDGKYVDCVFSFINLKRTSCHYSDYLLVIQIMHKKAAQTQAKDAEKHKPELLEEQSEPFLKVLNKRIRNINKKLAEISDLETKDNLKPEQIQKVNRKTAVLEERTKTEQTLALYKQTYADNLAYYRNNQLKHLQALARALSIYHEGGKVEEQQKLTNLWRVLEQSDKTYSSLNEAISALSSALKEFANDKAFQKSLLNYTDKNGNAKTQIIDINHQKIVSDILEEKKESKAQSAPEKREVIEEVVPEKKDTPAPVVVPLPATIAQPAAVIETEQKIEPVTTIEQPVVVEQPTVAAESPPVPVIQETPAPTVEQTGESPKEGETSKNTYRQNKPRVYKERRDYEQQPREKKYKPKYEEKKPEAKTKEQKDSSSSDSSPEGRDFRREEIKKLQEEGFIVVGKPKPKAKDQQQLRGTHQKQHGNKDYPTHNPKN